MTTTGMATNMSVWSVTNITIWDLATSGWSVTPFAWATFMRGSVFILIGTLMGCVMTITEPTAAAVFTQDMTGRMGLKGVNDAGFFILIRVGYSCVWSGPRFICAPSRGKPVAGHIPRS